MSRPRRVETAADRDEAVATFADAFFDDPVFSWIVEDSEQRSENLSGWFERSIDAAAHGSHVDLLPGSAAFWMPPKSVGGAHPSDPDDSWVVTFLVDLLGEEVAMSKLVELAKIPKEHPTEPHWYLGVIGTRADAQGQGNGSQLLAQQLLECDAAHMPAYLESSNPRNVSLYLRHGWETTGTIQLGDDGPVLTTMWRDSR